MCSASHRRVLDVSTKFSDLPKPLAGIKILCFQIVDTTLYTQIATACELIAFVRHIINTVADAMQKRVCVQCLPLTQISVRENE